MAFQIERVTVQTDVSGNTTINPKGDYNVLGKVDFTDTELRLKNDCFNNDVQDLYGRLELLENDRRTRIRGEQQLENFDPNEVMILTLVLWRD